jgi:hypothetical protein
MSILFHHYKELTEIISEVEQMEQATVSSKKRLAINEEEEEEKNKKIVKRLRKRSHRQLRSKITCRIFFLPITRTPTDSQQLI